MSRQNLKLEEISVDGVGQAKSRNIDFSNPYCQTEQNNTRVF
jgi:hypothetical protein